MKLRGHIGVVTANFHAVANVDLAAAILLAVRIEWRVDGTTVLGKANDFTVGSFGTPSLFNGSDDVDGLTFTSVADAGVRLARASRMIMQLAGVRIWMHEARVNLFNAVRDR